MDTANEIKRLPAASRFLRGLPAFFRYAYLAFILVITVCVSLFANVFQYGFYSIVAKLDGPLIFLVALGLGAALTFILWRLRHAAPFRFLEEGKRFLVFILIGSAVMFCVQLILMMNMGFVAAHDYGTLTDVQFQQKNSGYYSIYPHNIFLEGVFTIIWNAAHALGLDERLCIVAGGCLCTVIAVALTSLVMDKVSGPALGVAAFVIGSIWLTASPMAQTPYSDSYGIVWPILVLFCYVCIQSPRLKWPLMVGFTFLAYNIKPHLIATFAIIVFVEVCMWASRKLAERKAATAPAGAAPTSAASKEARFANAGRTVLACVLAALVAFGAAFAIKSVPNVNINPEAELGVPHFLLMGVSDKKGVYSANMYEYSTSYPNKAERAEADLRLWSERVSALGPAGVADLMFSKMLTVYGDGAFLWGADNIRSAYGASPELRQFYGLSPDEDGLTTVERVNSYAYAEQVVLIMVLIGCALGLVRTRPTRMELVASCSLLLVSIYLSIFEASPRYLFTMAPFLIALSGMGWKGAAALASGLMSKRREHRKEQGQQQEQPLRSSEGSSEA